MPTTELPYNDPAQDGRRKILIEDYPKIKEAYQALQSLRKTAKLFNVDKRTIQFIIDPQKLTEHKAKNKLNETWKQYYTKEKHKTYMQNYRAKKKAHNLIVNKPTAKRKSP